MFTNLDKVNLLFHESRDYFCSPIMKKKFFCSQFMAIKNRHSWFTENPLSDPQNQIELCLKENSNFGRNGINLK